jgi:hypothetical protein
MPGDITLKGGAETLRQIMLKKGNLNKEICKGLLIAFAETVNLDNGSVWPEEMWN